MRWSSRWLILFLTAQAGCAPNTTPTPIYVGHVSDKTRLDKAGDQAELGIRLALHELLKDVAVAEALKPRTIHVRHTDTRGVLDAFESEAVRLDSINRTIAILGGMSGPEVSALDHVKTPILTFHGHPVSGASKHVFYLGMQPQQQGNALAKVLAENAKIQRVAILLDERRPESAVSADAFQRTLTTERAAGKRDAPNVLTLRFGKDVKWPEQTASIAAHSPHAIYFAGGVQDFNDWMKNSRKDGLGQDVPILFAGDDGGQRVFHFPAETKTPILFASAFSTDQATDKMAAFVKAFREAFQTEADVNAALAYDGMRMITAAIQHAQPTQPLPERVQEELLKIKDFPGLAGPLTITSDRQVERPIFVLRSENGVVTTLKKLPPAAEKKEKP
jgi:branched-chain amino acid transport system substrate-binding protein